jgi:uncharacterized protein (DUF2252 family)
VEDHVDQVLKFNIAPSFRHDREANNAANIGDYPPPGDRNLRDPSLELRVTYPHPASIPRDAMSMRLWSMSSKDRSMASSPRNARARTKAAHASRPEFHALPEAEYLPRITMQERVARGRALQHEVPHDRHASWQPLSTRPDPIGILERQALERIEELVPIRHGRMSSSAFAFFRGAAAVMASDLAGTATVGLNAQLCGDAHLMNFGIFETPERSLSFAVNDFDETLPGPFEWDVKRLAASMEVAGRDLGFTSAQRQSAVLATLRSYREAMHEFAGERELDLWYARLPAEKLRERLAAEADRGASKEVERQVRKALHRDHLAAFDRLVREVDGEIRFVSEPPLLVPVEELLDDEQRTRYVEVIRSFLTQYRESLPPHTRALLERYRFAHIARKVVGVGSVGTRAWAVLMVGRDGSDPMFLQLKEAQRSVLEPYTAPSVYESQGRRVVEGQRFMLAAGDHLLGWYRLKAWDGLEHDFYVRQLWDGKASIDIAHLSPAGFRAYGEACAWTLARGHARSGDRIAIASYLGEKDSFDRAVASFAETYAETNESDHERLMQAIDDGQMQAVPDI